MADQNPDLEILKISYRDHIEVVHNNVHTAVGLFEDLQLQTVIQGNVNGARRRVGRSGKTVLKSEQA